MMEKFNFKQSFSGSLNPSEMWCSINIIISVEKSQVFVSCFAQFCGNDTCYIYSSSKNIYLYKGKIFILLLYYYQIECIFGE